jgi:hypothetical protein
MSKPCDGVHATVDELFTCKECEYLFTPEIDEATNWEEEYIPEREQEKADEIRWSMLEDGEQLS